MRDRSGANFRRPAPSGVRRDDRAGADEGGVSEAVSISPAQGTGGEIRITRIFDAPRARVFEAWTEARHLVRWFGPRGFTAPVIEADVRRGGTWRACIRSPEGADYRMRGVYCEIVPPE